MYSKRTTEYMTVSDDNIAVLYFAPLILLLFLFYFYLS